jgi:acetylornithine/N-succinyldiaminopimelate aminotransferase
LADVRRRGERLWDRLQTLGANYPEVFAEVRGEGLLLGLRCVPPVAIVATAARAQGLLSVVAGENVLRLLPPLILSEADIDEAAARLRRAARALSQHDVAGDSVGATGRV